MKAENSVDANRYGWRFYQKPEAWTCFFVNLELTFAFFFFILYFDFKFWTLSYNRNLFEGLGGDLEDGRLLKGYQILGMEKKSKSKNINAFYLALKFDTLSWIWFLRMPKRPLKKGIWLLSDSCSENGKHLQKTMHYNTKCDGAVERASVSFFYLLTGMFLIAFVEKSMP